MWAFLAILTAGWAAIAPEPAYELRWAAPAACPDHAAVVQQIDGLLAGGREPGVFVTAEGVIERKGEEFSLALSITTGSGSRARTLVDRDCAELATVAASLVAIAIDPGLTHPRVAAPVAAGPEAQAEGEPAQGGAVAPEGAATGEGAGAGEAEGAAKPATAVAPPRPASPEASPPAAADGAPAPADRRPWGALVAGVGLSVGVLPSVAPTVHLGAGLGWRALYAQASVRHRAPRRVGDEAGATLWTLGADVRACGVPRAAQLRFPLCVGVEAGTIAGHSFGVSAPARGHAPWVAMSAGAGLLASLGRRLGLAVGVDLVVPVVRAGFEIEGIGELYRVGPIAMDAAIALQVKIP